MTPRRLDSDDISSPFEETTHAYLVMHSKRRRDASMNANVTRLDRAGKGKWVRGVRSNKRCRGRQTSKA